MVEGKYMTTASLQRTDASWRPDDDYDDRARWLDNQDGGDRWQNYAACRDADPTLFFTPTVVDPVTKIDKDEEPAVASPEAKQICDRCPVRAVCLDRNMEEEYGIFGGMTGYQRALLTRKIVRKHCPGCRSTDVVVGSNERKEICLACGTSWDVL